jgi:hypothetical protein
MKRLMRLAESELPASTEEEAVVGSHFRLEEGVVELQFPRVKLLAIPLAKK